MNAEILQIIKNNCKPNNDDDCWYQKSKLTLPGEKNTSWNLSRTKVFRALYPDIKIGMEVKPATFVKATCNHDNCLNPKHLFLKSKDDITKDADKAYREALAKEEQKHRDNYAKNIYLCSGCNKYFQGSKPHEVTGTRAYFCNNKCRLRQMFEPGEIEDHWMEGYPCGFEIPGRAEFYSQLEGKDYTARYIAVCVLLGCDGGTFDAEKYFCPKNRYCLESTHLIVKHPIVEILENNIDEKDKEYFYRISKGVLFNELTKAFIENKDVVTLARIFDAIDAVNTFNDMKEEE